MYQANVYTVMVASPSDVGQERKAAREVILEWNDMHSRETGIVLLPLLWENNTAPAMGDRPQALINKQMVDRADLLVAIFWTRFGSDTGVAPSGTVEEINEHSLKKRPTMLYFSTALVDPQAMDLSQYTALNDYRKTISKSALYFQFKTIDEFKLLFTRQLAMTINNDPTFVKLNKKGTVVDSSLLNVRLTPEMEILLGYSSQSPDGFTVNATNTVLEIWSRFNLIASIHHDGDTGRWITAIDELLSKLLWTSKDGTWENLQLTEAGAQLVAGKPVRVLGVRAKKLLRAALASKDGRILTIDRQGGLFITVSSNHMIEDRDMEIVAGYKAALRELEGMGLIEKDGAGYIVTDKGYRYGREYHLDMILGPGEVTHYR